MLEVNESSAKMVIRGWKILPFLNQNEGNCKFVPYNAEAIFAKTILLVSAYMTVLRFSHGQVPTTSLVLKLWLMLLDYNSTWSSQPKLDSAKGIGNVMITTTTELALY